MDFIIYIYNMCFSPDSNAFICFIITMTEHVCPLLLGVYVSYISSFTIAYLLFGHHLMFSPFAFAILFCSCLMGKKGVKSIPGAGSFYLHFCRLTWLDTKRKTCKLHEFDVLATKHDQLSSYLRADDNLL